MHIMCIAANSPTRLCRGSSANRCVGLVLRGRRAFSLVEVVLALGIVAFVMVSVLGLMSVGIKANKESAEDIAVGFITQYVASTLRLEGFNEVSVNSDYADANPDFYFDVNGAPSTSQNGVFACTITRSTPSGAPANGTLFLKAEIAWPRQAVQRTTQIVQISLANRE